MNTINTKALSDYIADHITKQIISGELKPGQKLIEHTYATEYGTSRAPVREAIYLLTTEGLVERIPRKGAIVREYKRNEIFDILKIRNMLENMAMERIREHGVNKEIIEKMKELLIEMKEEKDVHAYTQLNHLFHSALIDMSDSGVIKDMYARLGKPLLTIQNFSFSDEGNIEKSVKEHEMIVLGLVDNNIKSVIKVLSYHNDDVVKNVSKKLDA